MVGEYIRESAKTGLSPKDGIILLRRPLGPVLQISINLYAFTSWGGLGVLLIPLSFDEEAPGLVLNFVFVDEEAPSGLSRGVLLTGVLLTGSLIVLTPGSLLFLTP